MPVDGKPEYPRSELSASAVNTIASFAHEEHERRLSQHAPTTQERINEMAKEARIAATAEGLKHAETVAGRTTYLEAFQEAYGAGTDRAEMQWRESLRQRDMKPVLELTNKEIVSEARQLHTHFQQLTEKYEQAPVSQKAEIRELMVPVVNREQELRQEYLGRSAPEIKQDQAPVRQVSYGY